MKKTLLLSLVALGATAFASGNNNTFKMTLTQDSVIAGKTLKPGSYKVSVENGNAIIKQGNDTIEVAAHEVVNDTAKYASTSLVYQNDGKLSEIRFGGTHSKIVFEGDSSMHAGQ